MCKYKFENESFQATISYMLTPDAKHCTGGKKPVYLERSLATVSMSIPVNALKLLS